MVFSCRWVAQFSLRLRSSSAASASMISPRPPAVYAAVPAPPVLGSATPGVLPKLTATQEAETLWAQVMGVLDKTTVKDAIRFLGEKAAEACLDRVAELAEALKLQVRELRGVR